MAAPVDHPHITLNLIDRIVVTRASWHIVNDLKVNMKVKHWKNESETQENESETQENEGGIES